MRKSRWKNREPLKIARPHSPLHQTPGILKQSSVERPETSVQRQECKCPRPSSLVPRLLCPCPRLHTLFQLSTARLWPLDSFFFCPRPSSLDPRLSEGSAFGLGLRSQGCFVRGQARGIEDPGTVRKRDFEEMPWCNQGAGLREETASTARDYRAEWGG